MSKVIEMGAPKPRSVEESLAKKLGPEISGRIITDIFVTDFFDRVLYAVGEGNFGLRAVYVAEESGHSLLVSGWRGPEKINVTPIDEVLNRGGEYKSTSLLVTRVGKNDELGNPEVSMTREYLLFATNNCLNSDEDIRPAVLVYNLDEAIPESGTYKVTFSDIEVKKRSLLMVYPMDISVLRNALGGDAKIGNGEI